MMINGFIVVDKEAGKSSARVVSRIKYLVKQLDKTAKVGHLGTLDPDGEGVLPIAIGRATRLFDYLTVKVKVYYTEFKLGILTDTLDVSGVVTKTSEVIPTINDVTSTAAKFVGKYSQLPPQYSAKSYGGVKAYALARQGKTVPLEAKDVEIFSIVEVRQIEKDVFSMTVSCSGGTYIRSLARDMAQSLGTVGVMRYIKRLQSGCFYLKDAVKLDAITTLSDRLLPMDYPLVGYPQIQLSNDEEKRLLDGKIVETSSNNGLYRVYNDKVFVGLGLIEGGIIKMKTWLK